MKYIIAILLVLVSSAGYAADDNKYLHSNVPHAISGGITDNDNQEFKFFRTDANGYQKVTLGTVIKSDVDSIAVDFVSNATTNITTATTTAVWATRGALNSMIVNTGVSGTAAFYNIANAGCTGTPASGYAFTLSTTTAGNFDLHHNFTLGICVVTSAAANISILYKDMP